MNTIKLWSLLLLLGPIYVTAQQDLTGIWRIQEMKSFKGPQYSNGLPTKMKILQTNNMISFEVTEIVGTSDKDSTYTRELQIGYDKINEIKTVLGKKRTVVFFWDKKRNLWVRETVIYDKQESTKQERRITEEVTTEDKKLFISKKSELLDGKDDDNDFTMLGVYEKVSAEQLAAESAKGRGIAFAKNINWEQIKAKAKKENKYIFIDCYATWCGPCKMMDKEVLSLNMVGDVINKDFISIKVQVDSTKNDTKDIKLFSRFARQLEKEYSINALPSYLIFSSEGKPLHKIVGQNNPSTFLLKVNEAKDSDKQLYTLFNMVKTKRVPYSEYSVIAKKLKNQFEEKELALQVMREYMDGYINKLPETELLKREYIDIARQNMKLMKPTDKMFAVILKNQAKIDSLLKSTPIGEWENSWSYTFINRVLLLTIAGPRFEAAKKNSQTPDWGQIENDLGKVVDKERAKSVRMETQLYWYGSFKLGNNWNEYIKIAVQRLGQKDHMYIEPNEIDAYCDAIMKYSDDTALLNQALEWISRAEGIGRTWSESYKGVKGVFSPSWVYMMMRKTKADLFFRLGRKKDAIDLYRCIIGNWELVDDGALKYFAESMAKILNNEKVWEEARASLTK
ncbi:thiol-disulfide isomerase/thioredoxin [Pedobacter sp. AK017]|uniref:thioredoxin family protein n=1 Tax=Pedobacter sp. AK017 TaxID=2723073 RepID=UPI001622F046|nr:thioredoxin fold domain-containing protein [Pedobacter sp. AK017]MBB5440237.1 thiol-disulfide isomerase/thioredoxin [Pedobacter sp. AK017]